MEMKDGWEQFYEDLFAMDEWAEWNMEGCDEPEWSFFEAIDTAIALYRARKEEYAKFEKERREYLQYVREKERLMEE